MTAFERIVVARGAYDKRSTDPKKDYGIHGMELVFVLKGPKGATQFVVFTGMHLPHVQDELWRKRKADWNPFVPMGADIGYHSPTPMREGDTPLTEHCEFLGGPCHYDGSSLSADEFMPIFLKRGTEAVWPMLEERYHLWFDR